MRYFSLLFLFIIFLGCSKEEIKKIDVSNIRVKTDIQRFDQKFYTSSIENLGELKTEYPFLFPEPNPDSVWVNKMQNKDEQDLFAESQKLFADFSSEEEQLNSLFKHLKYYYPSFKEPKVITILTNVDYNNNVVLVDSLLFISLDIFLGKENEVYHEFPNYVKQNYNKDHLIVAVAEKFAEQIIPQSKSKSYVSRMIQEGKKLALIQSLLPKVAQEEIIGYTKEQYIWAEKSEKDIWKYFIEKSMLYSTDVQLSARFIDEAPFSKFFLTVDKDSPGRIGVWFGWQIVNSYLKNNEISLQKAMLTENEEIFKRSKYKPKKY
ncbi:MAG: gliding motility lipoprotein GldB [Flavobacteriaceae bacterium]|nr:gliding motility lipoprotein GldB [Flavobacteriaceae bacterium]